MQNGANSASWGSGAIGGAISAGSSLTQVAGGWNIRYAGLLGSFGENSNGIKVGFSGNRFAADVRAYRQQSQNNFNYRNMALPGLPVDTLANAYFFQQGAMGQVRWRFTGNEITLRSWYQSSDRGIPATMLEVQSRARQKDDFLRSMLTWRWVRSKLSTEVKAAVLKEYLWFDTGVNTAEPISETYALSMIVDAQARWFVRDGLSLAFGANNTWTQAEVTEYVPLTVQNRTSIFAGAHFVKSPRWNLMLNLRGEQVDGKLVPPVGSFGIDFNAAKWLTLKAAVARNYRIPTFNDRFWVPGGNPDLKPEDSWSEELGADFHYRFHTFIAGDFFVRYAVTAYNRYTKNWILWQPGPGYWYPQNLLEVESRGVEHRLKAEWKYRSWAVRFLAGYDYVRAVNTKSKIPNDPSVGLQLMYVPAHRMNGMLQVEFRKFYLSYVQQYNGIRFTATDHSSYLPAYSVAQLTAGKRFDLKRSTGDIFFRVNNLFDKEYQAITWRPMPGRSYQLGLTIDLNFKKEKTTTDNP
jgi:iron complex outermembrane receptor protein